MTTVASGRCTSAPVPVARAIGMNPNEATNAVIKTGRRRVSDPCRIASSKGSPSSRRFSMNEIITMPFSTATPERAMNPTAAEIDNGIPLSHKERNPPVNAKGTPVNTNSALAFVPNAANNNRVNQNKGQGNHHPQSLRCGNQVLELAAPLDPITRLCYRGCKACFALLQQKNPGLGLLH